MTADTTTNHRSELLARALDHLDRGELEVWATGRIPGRDAEIDWDATDALRRHLGVADPAAVVVTTDGAAARWQSGLGRWDPVPADNPAPAPACRGLGHLRLRHQRPGRHRGDLRARLSVVRRRRARRARPGPGGRGLRRAPRAGPAG